MSFIEDRNNHFFTAQGFIVAKMEIPSETGEAASFDP